MQIFRHHVDLVGCAEQKRPMDAEDRRVIRNVFVLQDVDPAIFNVIVGDLRNRGGGGHTADEQQRGQDHARLHGHSKIRKDGQRERDQPHADVGLRELEQRRNLHPLAHVVAHDHQDSRQHRHGHETHQLRGKEQNAEQGQGVNHARHRSLCSGTNVGCRARDGSRSRQSAKHRRHNVGDALRYKFHIRIVRRQLRIAHAI